MFPGDHRPARDQSDIKLQNQDHLEQDTRGGQRISGGKSCSRHPTARHAAGSKGDGRVGVAGYRGARKGHSLVTSILQICRPSSEPAPSKAGSMAAAEADTAYRRW